MFGGTLGAYAFHDVVDFPGNEPFRKIDVGNEILVQAIGIVAYLTIEVAVFFVFAALAVVVADAIFVRTASVVHAVDEMMFVEKDEGAENDRFVDAVELLFQRTQAKCVGLGGNGLIDEQSGGGGAYAGRLQNCGIVFCFHKKRCLSCDLLQR